jgi:hypothetical protein
MSWLSVLLVEETAVPGENHRPVAYHIMLYRVHLAWVGFDLTTLVVIDTDYTKTQSQIRDLKKNGDLRQNDIDIPKKQHESEEMGLGGIRPHNVSGDRH